MTGPSRTVVAMAKTLGTLLAIAALAVTLVACHGDPGTVTANCDDFAPHAVDIVSSAHSFGDNIWPWYASCRAVHAYGHVAIVHCYLVDNPGHKVIIFRCGSIAADATFDEILAEADDVQTFDQFAQWQDYVVASEAIATAA